MGIRRGVAPADANGVLNAEGLARRMVTALRRHDIEAARRVLATADRAGATTTEVYEQVITPAMVRIGELWAAGRLRVADEQLATALVARLLEERSPDLVVEVPGSRPRIVLAAPKGQHHALGLRMVGDVLEGSGYVVDDLGTDVAEDHLLEAVGTPPAYAVGLSYALPDPDGLRGLVGTLAARVQRIAVGGHGLPDRVPAPAVAVRTPSALLRLLTT